MLLDPTIPPLIISNYLLLPFQLFLVIPLPHAPQVEFECQMHTQPHAINKSAQHQKSNYGRLNIDNS